MADSPLIVDVKRSSHEDGPGIRSVVFFKGCPLRCDFCQNPETQDPKVEIAFSERDCIGCGSCADACPRGAADMEHPGRIRRDECRRCGECVRACPGRGLALIGAAYSLDELMEILMRDRPYYRHSKGGVTLSGGECTLYPNYLEPLLTALKDEGIHVALETSGYFDYSLFREKILPHLDLIYYDVKIIDPGEHERRTGKSNRKILDNLAGLAREDGVEVHPRVPIVPGVTDMRENLGAIIEYLYRIGVGEVTLLPYNPMGANMYLKLGRDKPPLPECFMKPEREKEIFRMFSNMIDSVENASRTAQECAGETR